MIYHLRYSSFFPLIKFPRIVIINNLLKYNALHLVYATFWYIMKHRCTHSFHLFYSFHKKQITPIFIVCFTTLGYLPSYRILPFPLWITFLFHKLLSFSVALYGKKKNWEQRYDISLQFFLFSWSRNYMIKDPIFLDNSLNYMYLSYTFSSIYGIIDYEKN